MILNYFSRTEDQDVIFLLKDTYEPFGYRLEASKFENFISMLEEQVILDNKKHTKIQMHRYL